MTICPINERDLTFILEGMCSLAGVAPFPVDAEIGDTLRVDVEGTSAVIRYPDKNALARGCFLAAEAIKRGERLHIDQKRHFDDCGVMIDMSRGGVMNVCAVKKVIEQSAALGMNFLQLYTEDTYTVPEYPRFGYLRGRYTKEELRTLDDYADAYGIELVPCIQTLAHLGQFLQWKENAHMKDQATILLIDEPDVYTFIEAEIRAVRDCFRSKRIHIGMDEAHGVGLGQYFAKHGLVDRFELLNRHLTKVVDICSRYDFKPMMWSDMFFRLGSKTNEYYDLESHVPDDIIARIPDVQLVYWDYYNTDSNLIDAMVREHNRIKPGMVFAGGIWTWSGFLPQIALTDASMRPALECCLKYQVKTVFTCLWGDDGTETPYSLAASMFPLFSEACWTGKVPGESEVAALGKAISGIPAAAFDAFRYFYKDETDNRNGKGFLYTDLLYPLCVNDFPAAAVAARLQDGIARLTPYRDTKPCAYALAVMTVAAHKAEIISHLRERYIENDKAYLERVADEEIPKLLEEIQALTLLHRDMWRQDFKRNGWEVLALRYGAISGRLNDVRTTLHEYLRGDIGKIDELEEAPMDSTRKSGMQYYQVYAAPSFSA